MNPLINQQLPSIQSTISTQATTNIGGMKERPILYRKSPNGEYSARQVMDYISKEVFGNKDINITPVYDDRVLKHISGNNQQMATRAMVSKLPGDHAYRMLIDPTLKGKDLVNTISHEMAHLDQYERGDLNETPDRQLYWKGQKADTFGKKYQDRPWEAEAYKRQYDIANQVFKTFK